MSFADAAQPLLAAALPDGVIVVTTTPAPTDGATFDGSGAIARIRSVVSLYDGPDPSAGPYQTSSEATLYAACYGTGPSAARDLARQVRAALPAQTRLDDYRFRPTSVATPVLDYAYNPPEWYCLVRFAGLGLYGDT